MIDTHTAKSRIQNVISDFKAHQIACLVEDASPVDIANNIQYWQTLIDTLDNLIKDLDSEEQNYAT